jgi:hypothetical protein
MRNRALAHWQWMKDDAQSVTLGISVVTSDD